MDGRRTNPIDHQKKLLTAEKKQFPVVETLGIGADSNRRRQRTTTPFEHGNRRLRARPESMRCRQSEHGAGGGGLVSVKHLEGFEKQSDLGNFFYQEISFFDYSTIFILFFSNFGYEFSLERWESPIESKVHRDQR